MFCVYAMSTTQFALSEFTCCSNCRNEELPTMTRTAGNCSAHQPNPYFCNMKGLLCQKVSAYAAQQVATARKGRRLPMTHIAWWYVINKQYHVSSFTTEAFECWSTLCCRRALVHMISWENSCCSPITLRKEHGNLSISMHILLQTCRVGGAPSREQTQQCVDH